MMTDEDNKAIERTARLLAGNHADIEGTLIEAMTEIAKHHFHSGAHPKNRWIASVEAYGQMLVTLAKREQRKLKDSY